MINGITTDPVIKSTKNVCEWCTIYYYVSVYLNFSLWLEKYEYLCCCTDDICYKTNKENMRPQAMVVSRL